MDIALKTVLTATFVTGVVLAARWLGAHAAGLVSGLPITIVPAVLLAGGERGAGAAADVAAGGVVGCVLACIFAIAYHRAARRHAPLSALLLALAALAGGLTLAQAAQPGFGLAGALACAFALGVVAFFVIGRPALPVTTPPQPTVRRITRQAAGAAAAAGAVSAAIAPLALTLDPALAGTVAAMPMIAIASVAMHHADGGCDSAARFLRGYVFGSMLRAAFCAVLAVVAVRAGTGPALLAAVGLTALGWLALCSSAARRVLRPDEPRRTLPKPLTRSLLPPALLSRRLRAAAALHGNRAPCRDGVGSARGLHPRVPLAVPDRHRHAGP